MYSFGGELITITGSGFESCPGFFGCYLPIVEINGKDCYIINNTNTEIICQAPPNPPGNMTLEVDIPEKGKPYYQVSRNVEYILVLNDLQPRRGSIFGGALLTVSGLGFSDNDTENKVLIAGNECKVMSSSLTEIKCRAVAATKTVYVDNNGNHERKSF